MNQLRNLFKPPLGLLFGLLTVVAGCGGSMDPVLGTPGASSVAPPATVPPVTTDTTRPTVTTTVPAPGAADVPTNRKVTAVFSEDMNPGSISTTSFTVRNTALDSPVAGTVTYSVSARTATFTPSSLLASNSPFTAIVTSAATDLAGNRLAGDPAALPAASDYRWTFNSGAVADSIAPTVAGVSPADGTSGICLTKTIAVTFSESMDPASITAANFSVMDNGVAVPGNVTYDPATLQGRFVPTAAAGFAMNRPLQVTIRSGIAGVLDLAGNPLATDEVWSFTTGTQACNGAVNLRTAALFGAFGGAAGVTNQGVNTIVNGHLGTTAVCTAITGFHDGANVYTETMLNVGGVNGTVYCGPPAPGTTTTAEIAAQARADAQTAYNELAALPAGSDPGAGQLGGLTLDPGTYTAAGGTFNVTTGNLTLDAKNDADAVWVFQSASALTVGLEAIPRRVLLINGAQAKNVFWQVGSAARIEDGSSMVGTIIAPAGVTISTAGQTAQTTLTGRALGLTASVTMVNTTVVAP